MVSANKLFSGVHSVIFALYNSHGDLDFKLMERQVDQVISVGVKGITVLGLATEVNKLKYTEQRSIVEAVVQSVNGRVPVSVTVTGNSVQCQREFCNFSQDAGADWLILQPPFDNSFSSKKLRDFFSKVSDVINVPFAIQNAPEYLNNYLTDEDIRIMELDINNFQLIKAETSSEPFSRLIESQNSNMTMLNGRGGLEMVDCLRAGCDGFVIAPDVVDHAVQIYQLWTCGKFKEADIAYRNALPAMVFSMQSIDHLLTYGKRIYGLRSGTPIYDRDPSITPTPFGLDSTERWANSLGAYSGSK